MQNRLEVGNGVQDLLPPLRRRKPAQKFPRKSPALSKLVWQCARAFHKHQAGAVHFMFALWAPHPPSNNQGSEGWFCTAT